MNQITVLLAEDHVIVREGLCALLKMESDIQIVGMAGNGRQAVHLTRTLSPEVVVMDIAMPLLNGIEATRQILQTHPETKVIILSAHSDDAYVATVMEAGAAGYLIKQTAARGLSEAIRKVHQGQAVFSPIISRKLAHQRKLKEEGDLSLKNGSAQLTSRETEVLQLVAEGMTNKESAQELKISIKTVEKHRQSLMVKLNIHDTAGLTRYAISTGIIESHVQVTIL